MTQKSFQIISMFVFISILFVAISILKVTQITCIQNGATCSVPIYSTLEVIKGDSLFFTDINQTLINRYNGVLPFQILSIERELPGTLVITLKEENPLYLIFTSDTQTMLTGISANGSTVSFDTAPSSIPVVKISSAGVAFSDKELNPFFHETIKKIIDNSSSSQYVLQNIAYISGTEIILNYNSIPSLIITTDVPVYALQHIEKIMYTVETQTLEKPVKEIDLRFRLPVLRTET